jgi:glycosyltransferase involved in cell wall biosynthesis
MEWIIVNDASTDRSAYLLQKYRARDDRVKLCLNTVRRGYTDSYGFAVSKAEGDYIAFLEPENLWVKDKISRQVGFMKRYATVLTHTSYAFSDNRCNLMPTGCAYIEPSMNLINFRKPVDICLSSFMMNAAEVKKFFPIVQDQDKEKVDLLMYLIKKGFVSQGMHDVLTLCRLDYDYPRQVGAVDSVKKLYKKMCLENHQIPSLMRYQAYKARNVTSIKMDLSMFVGLDVATSLDELKKFRL